MGAVLPDRPTSSRSDRSVSRRDACIGKICLTHYILWPGVTCPPPAGGLAEGGHPPARSLPGCAQRRDKQAGGQKAPVDWDRAWCQQNWHGSYAADQVGPSARRCQAFQVNGATWGWSTLRQRDRSSRLSAPAPGGTAGFNADGRPLPGARPAAWRAVRPCRFHLGGWRLGLQVCTACLTRHWRSTWRHHWPGAPLSPSSQPSLGLAARWARRWCPAHYLAMDAARAGACSVPRY